MSKCIAKCTLPIFSSNLLQCDSRVRTVNPARARVYSRRMIRGRYISRRSDHPAPFAPNRHRRELPHHEATLTANWLAQLLSTLPRWLPCVYCCSPSCSWRWWRARPRRSSTRSTMRSTEMAEDRTGTAATGGTVTTLGTTVTVATAATAGRGRLRRLLVKGRLSRRSAGCTSQTRSRSRAPGEWCARTEGRIACSTPWSGCSDAVTLWGWADTELLWYEIRNKSSWPWRQSERGNKSSPSCVTKIILLSVANIDLLRHLESCVVLYIL